MENDVFSSRKLACAKAVIGSMSVTEQLAWRAIDMLLWHCRNILTAVTTHMMATCLAQVVMMTGGEVQCPISLETNPLCPQITPCGHVFAFHSIMQHLMTQVTDCLKVIACVFCTRTLSLLKMCSLCFGHVQLLDALASKLSAQVL